MTDRARWLDTGLPAGSVSTTRTVPLADGWTLGRTAPGAAETPGALAPDIEWRSAIVPGTVASTVDPERIDGHMEYDAWDWWYRTSLPDDSGPSRIRLRFDGLATLCQAWVNGTLVLESENMFGIHEVDVTDLVQGNDDLVLVFRSLGEALGERRPRPRWKTQLVENQRLRWFRTTLLGRAPGWMPAIQPVGPWRGVFLERCDGVDLRGLSLRARPDGNGGRVTVDAALGAPSTEMAVEGATIRVGTHESGLSIASTSDGWRIHGELEIDSVERWWPRTHGEPTLYPCEVALQTSDGPATIDCGNLGFRTVEIDDSDGALRFVVNDVPIFARGGCWSTNDIVSLTGDPDRMWATLGLVADAHANMVRVGGTMVYETDAFYDACDRLGLMVWQDFMFANMDYPVDDEGFATVVHAEAKQEIHRIGRHPSVVAFCGGSEVQQQAAMFGAPSEAWSNAFFDDTLPQLIDASDADAAYWPSTPTGGVLPFHVGEGLAHYYGVGAYRRPLDDVRLAGVRFTPECLGFSNVPEPSSLKASMGSGSPAHHASSWKAGVPRDSGAGWDFEDVRDHYLELLYDVDAVRLRSEDPSRYTRLSRVVTGRVMARVFDEWRTSESGCGGGLVWFLNDLRPGAGWGIIDHRGRPKPVYYFLKRAWAPRRVALLDRGLDGVIVEILNEHSDALEGRLEVTVLGPTSAVLATSSTPVAVPARGHERFNVEALIGRFSDPTYAYRFGPPAHAAIHAELIEGDVVVASEIHWRDLADRPEPTDLDASIDDTGSGSVTAEGLAMDVRIDLRDRTTDQNYFDLAPGDRRNFQAVSETEDGRIRGVVEALNDPLGVRLTGGS